MQANTEEALDAKSFFRRKQDPIHLTDIQAGFLVEFLKTLTDPCTKDRECLSPWVPERDTGNTDQLDAYDQNDNWL